MSNRIGQSIFVAFGTQPANRPHCQVAEVRMTPEWLAGVDVRKMYLYERDPDRRQRIPQGYAGVVNAAGLITMKSTRD